VIAYLLDGRDRRPASIRLRNVLGPRPRKWRSPGPSYPVPVIATVLCERPTLAVAAIAAAGLRRCLRLPAPILGQRAATLIHLLESTAASASSDARARCHGDGTVAPAAATTPAYRDIRHSRPRARRSTTRRATTQARSCCLRTLGASSLGWWSGRRRCTPHGCPDTTRRTPDPPASRPAARERRAACIRSRPPPREAAMGPLSNVASASVLPTSTFCRASTATACRKPQTAVSADGADPTLRRSGLLASRGCAARAD